MFCTCYALNGVKINGYGQENETKNAVDLMLAMDFLLILSWYQQIDL